MFRTTHIDHIPEFSTVSRMCSNCLEKRSSCFCKCCEIHLCLHARSGRSVSCYKAWHSKDRLCIQNHPSAGGHPEVNDHEARENSSGYEEDSDSSTHPRTRIVKTTVVTVQVPAFGSDPSTIIPPAVSTIHASGVATLMTGAASSTLGSNIANTTLNKVQ